MRYAVFRFNYNDEPNQWIIPYEKLLANMSITQRRVVVPVTISVHGQICNVAFHREKRRLSTNENEYWLFELSIQPGDTVLNKLMEHWTGLAYAQRVKPVEQNQTNLYRL
jgi:hypothetical protein